MNTERPAVAAPGRGYMGNFFSQLENSPLFITHFLPIPLLSITFLLSAHVPLPQPVFLSLRLTAMTPSKKTIYPDPTEEDPHWVHGIFLDPLAGGQLLPFQKRQDRRRQLNFAQQQRNLEEAHRQREIRYAQQQQQEIDHIQQQQQWQLGEAYRQQEIEYARHHPHHHQQQQHQRRHCTGPFQCGHVEQPSYQYNVIVPAPSSFQVQMHSPFSLGTPYIPHEQSSPQDGSTIPDYTNPSTESTLSRHRPCTRCRKLHAKCDKQEPCSNCFKAREVCVPQDVRKRNARPKSCASGRDPQQH
ncbi:hypothetical protein GQ43DRAFT_475472 [Delitschia confertaspora ATCC 74209]|uniref:Zn(2)-C6 fungal-type domain-containing protein n=1 Tax=Delitschia confertaspora ATCC 74209 TaxID=1513339 RepID=A0A9P4MUW0_9PLEO|nr:hypothetical protein GQ43DRAFT_475472 [Delitschia confertaspora ATCC 74209]